MTYVVYWHEHLRDGNEFGAKVVYSIPDALDLINSLTGHGNVDCRLFELGRELPLTTERTEEPQPAKVRTRFKLAE